MNDVQIWTDGSCLRNPGGAGGWSAILLFGDGRRQEISGGVRSTTNNRMELRAAVEALATLASRHSVRLFTDATYLSSTFFSVRLRHLGLVRKKRPIPNDDLWDKLIAASKVHEIQFLHVAGHCGDPENTKADFLAGIAARQPDLPPDLGYECRPMFKPRIEPTTRERVQAHEKFMHGYPKSNIEQLILACDAD